MVHGHKDFGEGQATQIIHSVPDLGELASRLGSPNKFHRGGNVIFQTDFEDGLNNCDFSSGWPGASYHLTDAETYSGGVACFLQDMGIDIFTRPIELTKLGFELAWIPIDEVDSLEIVIYHDDAVVVRKYRIIISLSEEAVKITDDTGANIEISDYDFNDPYIVMWQISKLVVDLENYQYDTFYYNDLEFDITTYEPQEFATSGDKRLRCTFSTNPNLMEVSEVIIDNIIITINEP